MSLRTLAATALATCILSTAVFAGSRAMVAHTPVATTVTIVPPTTSTASKSVGQSAVQGAVKGAVGGGAGGPRIGGVVCPNEDDRDALGGRVVLHHFVVKDESGRSMDMCAPDPDGRSLGFPLPDGRGGFDLTCTSGVIGKCIRWGYRPWEEKPGGPPLRSLHQACVHMARADYGGDGRATTRDGTIISFCDRFGIHPCGQGAPMAFEAAWGVDSAICVARPRIPENISLAQLAERYPRLKPRLGRTCTLDSAMRDPDALLFNRSGE